MYLSINEYIEFTKLAIKGSDYPNKSNLLDLTRQWMFKYYLIVKRLTI